MRSLRFSLRSLLIVVGVTAVCVWLGIILVADHPPVATSRITIGMTKQQVVDAIGEPDWVEQDTRELWAYWEGESFVEWVSGGWMFPIYISFDENGKVDSKPWS